MLNMFTNKSIYYLTKNCKKCIIAKSILAKALNVRNVSASNEYNPNHFWKERVLIRKLNKIP